MATAVKILGLRSPNSADFACTHAGQQPTKCLDGSSSSDSHILTLSCHALKIKFKVSVRKLINQFDSEGAKQPDQM